MTEQEYLAALAAKDEIIAELTAQVKAVHLAWRLALAPAVPSATLKADEPVKTP